jgi:serine protease Do
MNPNGHRRLVPPASLFLLSMFCCCHRGENSVGQPVTLTAASAPAPFSSVPAVPPTPDVAALVAAVKPAVVNVTTVEEVRIPPEWPFHFEDPFGGSFSPFERRAPGKGAEGGPMIKRRGEGSGFIIDPRGYVVTNAHVVVGARSLHVRLADDREFDAVVKGRDPRLDVAVIELHDAKDLPVAALGSSAELRVGDSVVAIGNAFGLGNSVTMGIVSAKSRDIGAGPYDDFIQTDASINPGNSGGPLYNVKGEVVGINTAMAATGRGIGFAIPVDALKDVLPQLLSTGHVARARLGALVQGMDLSLAKALGLDRPKGALVGEVGQGTPAAKAGLKAGDVILSVGGTYVAHAHELPRIVTGHPPGAHVTLGVWRDGTSRTLNAVLDELKEEPSEASSETSEGPSPHHPPDLGVELEDAPGGGAVVDRVLPGSLAEGSLMRGDLIVEIDRARVTRASDATARLRGLTGSRSPVLLQIKREGVTRFVAIEPH